MTTSEAVLCAHNNALWCDAVCRAHGLPGEFLAGLWLNRQPVPRFYSNAITLSPKDPAGQRAWVAHLMTRRPHFSVKDSFAALDLSSLGFDVLFEATWLWRDPAAVHSTFGSGLHLLEDGAEQVRRTPESATHRGEEQVRRTPESATHRGEEQVRRTPESATHRGEEQVRRTPESATHRGEEQVRRTPESATHRGEEQVRRTPESATHRALDWSVVKDAAGLARWEAAWAGLHEGEVVPGSERIFRRGLLHEPGVALLAGAREGQIVAVAAANQTGDVVGLSNVFAPAEDEAAVWAGVVGFAAALFPGRPLVGYERGDDLAQARAAGFRPVGPLRVWAR